MTKLTGEQLTKLFFTKVKGWKRGDIIQLLDRGQYSEEYEQKCWIKPDRIPFAKDGRIFEGKAYGDPLELPSLHTSLDLQAEWVWPELRKKNIYEVVLVFCDKNFLLEKESAWHCLLYKEGEATLFSTEGVGETQAEAQLKAALKALAFSDKNENG